MAKVVCVLYDDPVDGYPKSYVRDDLPKLTHYPDGQTLPTPKAIDFAPGADAHPDAEPIQIVFDFTMGLAELEAADDAA
jgi:hypothetical protein